eukprot:scaffold207_cov409-Prasinococcus_capsulatus_cf.AAC.121
MSGIMYVVLLSPCLLVGGSKSTTRPQSRSPSPAPLNPTSRRGLMRLLFASPQAPVAAEGPKKTNESFMVGQRSVSDSHGSQLRLDESVWGFKTLVAGAKVSPASKIVGETVQSAGLRGLEGLYLTSVLRGEMLARAIGRDFLIQAGDILIFTGRLQATCSTGM